MFHFQIARPRNCPEISRQSKVEIGYDLYDEQTGDGQLGSDLECAPLVLSTLENSDPVIVILVDKIMHDKHYEYAVSLLSLHGHWTPPLDPITLN